MIDAVGGRLFLMNGHDCFADVVGRHDVDFILGTERKNRHLSENVESLDHIELRSLRPAAVSHNDGGTKKRLGHIGEKLIGHVLAEFLGARVGIVIGAGPVDGGVFGDDFVFSFSRDGDGGNVRIAAQAVAILSTAGELNDFERASQVDVEALLLRFAVQRSSAMD